MSWSADTVDLVKGMEVCKHAAFRVSSMTGFQYDDLIGAATVGMTKALQTYDPTRGWCKWRSWLYTKAFGECLAEVRRCYGRADQPDEQAAERRRLYSVRSFTEASSCDVQPTPLDILAREDLELLELAIDALGPSERYVIRGMFFDRTKSDDLASGLGLTRQRVFQIRDVALAKLKSALKKLGVTSPGDLI